MMALLLNKPEIKQINKMKKTLTLLLFLTLSLAVAQKKEVRKAIKLFNAGDVQGASDMLTTNAALFENADTKVLNQKLYLEARIAQTNKEYDTAIEKYNAFTAAGGVDPTYETQIQTLVAELVNSAIEDNGASRYAEAASKLYSAYTINKEVNQDYLYFAASSAVNGQLLDTALDYYKQLKEIKYEGITTSYFAVSEKSGEEVELSQSEYELYQKSKDYSGFREEKSESRYPEIIKNIALIYAQMGDNEMAMTAVKEARQTDPKDLNLILTEANLYIQLKENDRFEALMKEAIEQDPNNATLYFNLGVVSAQKGSKEEAEGYYKKTIELDPNYEAGYLNLVSLILEEEADIISEMDGLGRSAADNKRYDELLKSREDLYRECIPILSKLVDIANNEQAIKTLMNIYGSLGETENYNKMKALLE